MVRFRVSLVVVLKKKTKKGNEERRRVRTRFRSSRLFVRLHPLYSPDLTLQRSRSNVPSPHLHRLPRKDASVEEGHRPTLRSSSLDFDPWRACKDTITSAPKGPESTTRESTFLLTVPGSKQPLQSRLQLDRPTRLLPLLPLPPHHRISRNSLLPLH